jgi:demethylmenaquinone methyltransferase/2-methoxy-6-polyprenyl-1,4-benzoquinol methylase
VQEKISSLGKTLYVHDMFAKIAPRYDFMNRIMSFGIDRLWRRFAVRKAAFRPGSRILDLGIGTGDMAREIIKLIQDACVTGLDNCAKIMERGKTKPSLHAVEWVVGDGRNIPFADNYFDGVTAAFSIRNMEELSGVFSEIFRVVVPGGKILLLDMVQPEGYVVRKLFRFYFGHVIPLLGKVLGNDPEAYSYLFPSIESFYSSVALKDVLKGLGLMELFSKDIMLKTVLVWVGMK